LRLAEPARQVLESDLVQPVAYARLRGDEDVIPSSRPFMLLSRPGIPFPRSGAAGGDLARSRRSS